MEESGLFTSAGTDGIAVAPGFHLALVQDEFAGNAVAVVELPSTSGTGTPAFGDYAVAVMPNTPDGNEFSDGLDPHTLTAYVSPNNGKAYGLVTSPDPEDTGTGANFVGVIDLQALLAAPRCTTGETGCVGTHQVDPTYDLLSNGVVRYVCAQSSSCTEGGRAHKTAPPVRHEQRQH
jgi:hypothetical protein